MVSIHDIAKKAGVSITTVSKALNNYPDISPVTRQRILEICRQMDYTPNPSARNLAAKRSRNIALVLSDIKETDANGNIIFRLLVGAHAACNNRGYELSIVFTDQEKMSKKSLVELCAQRNLCGVVLYGLKISDPYYEQLKEINIPCVTIDIDIAADNVSVVSTDNYAAVAELVNLLYLKKRKKISMVNGAKNARISYIREDAFRKAMDNQGLKIEPGMIRYADFFEDTAYGQTLDLLEEHPETDAIFAASDLMALGVIRALKKMKKRIPDDIAVAGFDGIQVGEFISPPLTTIFQDFKQMGKMAAIKVINGVEGKTAKKIEYASHELIIRRSV